MSQTYDWYFDFISPFAYLQWRRLHRDFSVFRIQPKPILFAGLLKHWGQLGPAEIPGKRIHTYRIVLWQAHSVGIPLRFPPAHPFNPLPALRLALAAKDIHLACDLIFKHIWEHGLAADTPEALQPVADALGIEDLAACLADPEVKNKLVQNGEQALALKIFGVPTLVINHQLFWGNDATEMAMQYIANPSMMDDDKEMKRINDLPEAIQRMTKQP
ncbi:MAG: 2-hydroxychromene-2-carboxylate isomerase [Methylococcales bacterium]